MRIGVIAPGSVLGKAVTEQLSTQSRIITFGRDGADISFEIGMKNEMAADVPPVDVIIHCAANFGGSKLLDWREAAIVNTVGAIDVLRLAESVRASQVINISSIRAVPENADEDPTGHGLSKRQGEEWFALGARRAGITVLNLRLGAFYTDDRAGSRHQPFLYALMAKAAAGEEFVLNGENDPVRNYLHVDDVVAALQRAVSRKLGGLHALIAPQSYRLIELISLAYQTFGRKVRLSRDRSKPDLNEIALPSPIATYDALGWRPAIDLPTGLRRIRARLHEGSSS